MINRYEPNSDIYTKYLLQKVAMVATLFWDKMLMIVRLKIVIYVYFRKNNIMFKKQIELPYIHLIYHLSRLNVSHSHPIYFHDNNVLNRLVLCNALDIETPTSIYYS